MTVTATMSTPAAPSEAPVGTEAPASSSSLASGLATPMTPEVAPAPAPTPSEENPAANVERPAGLPEGFTTVEELVAAYQKATANPVTGVPATPAASPVKVITEATKAAGIDFDAMVSDYHKTGSLTDAQYADLAKAGISRQFMDAAIAGQTAAIQAEITDIYSVVGGEEGFKTLQTWAGANLSQAERDELNSVIDTASAGVVKLALQGLQARYEAKNGVEPNLVGGGVAASGATAFESTYQITTAMADPRYESDPAYRAQVERRLAISTFN